MRKSHECFFFFFFNDTATTEIYTLSLHDALPICYGANPLLLSNNPPLASPWLMGYSAGAERGAEIDRKSTRLNSSHSQISYAVFCLKKNTELPPPPPLPRPPPHSTSRAPHPYSYM